MSMMSKFIKGYIKTFSKLKVKIYIKPMIVALLNNKT